MAITGLPRQRYGNTDSGDSMIPGTCLVRESGSLSDPRLILGTNMGHTDAINAGTGHGGIEYAATRQVAWQNTGSGRIRAARPKLYPRPAHYTVTPCTGTKGVARRGQTQCGTKMVNLDTAGNGKDQVGTCRTGGPCSNIANSGTSGANALHPNRNRGRSRLPEPYPAVPENNPTLEKGDLTGRVGTSRAKLMGNSFDLTGWTPGQYTNAPSHHTNLTDYCRNGVSNGHVLPELMGLRPQHPQSSTQRDTLLATVATSSGTRRQRSTPRTATWLNVPLTGNNEFSLLARNVPLSDIPELHVLQGPVTNDRSGPVMTRIRTEQQATLPHHTVTERLQS